MAESERQEVFRDHLEECLRHFGKWFNSKKPPRSHGRVEAMKPLMDFCGVSRQTAQNWLDDLEVTPKGVTQIKMLCYLDLHGYRVIELERMPRVVRNFAELIGFGILSAQKAAELVQYKNVADMYATLRGRSGIGKDKEDRMWTAWKENKDALEHKKKEAFERDRLEILFETTPAPKSLEQQRQPSESFASYPNVDRAAAIAIMSGILMLFDRGLFNDLSPSDIESIRRNGGSAILQLSANMSQLSSKLMTTDKG